MQYVWHPCIKNTFKTAIHKYITIKTYFIYKFDIILFNDIIAQ